MTVAFDKKFAVSWIKQVKTVLSLSCNNLKGLKVIRALLQSSI